MIDRIRTLERASAVLDPGAVERAALSRAAIDHAEAFYRWLETAPASSSPEEDGRGLCDSPISPEPIAMHEALALIERNVDRTGQNTASAGFLAYIPGGNLYHSAIGDFLAAVSNRFSGHFLGAPGAVRMENMLLRWMAGVVGYPGAASGNLTSGGSIANLIAITVAREAAGLRARDVERSVVYLTPQAHHCIAKGLRIAGVAECVKRFVPMDEGFRMMPESLDAAIARDRAAGLNPWLIVASAGTTDTGAVDPLRAIGEIARRHGIWYHVDGAYGGYFALCAEGKRLLDGIEASDSVVLDPHKGLYIPFGTGAVLVRDAKALRAPHVFDAAYIPDEAHALEEPSPTDNSPELSRHFRGLRLWLPLKLLGTRPFEAALEEKLLLARYFHQRMQGLDGFELGPPPDLSIVVFRYVPRQGDANDFNRRLLRAVTEDGSVSLSPTRLGDTLWIRLAILGFRTHLDTIDRAVEVLGEKAANLNSTA